MRGRIAGSLLCYVVIGVVGAAQTPPRRPDRLLQAGHAGLIQTLAFSADSRWLASGGYDKTLVIWNAATGDEVRTLAGHTTEITSVAFSPDNRHLVSGGAKGDLRVWDLARGTMVYAVNAGGHITHLSYSADGSLWAAAVDGASEDATARIEIHDAAAGTIVRSLPTTWSDTTAMTTTVAGRLLAAGIRDGEGSMRIWDVATGRVAISRPTGADAFSADGSLIASTVFSPRAAIVITEESSGRQRQSFSVSNPGAIAFSPDNTAIVVADTGSTQLTVWSIATGSRNRTIAGDPFGDSPGLVSVAFSPDGSQLAAAPYDGYSIRS